MNELKSNIEGRVDAAFESFAGGLSGKLFFAGALTESSARAIEAATKAGAASLVVAEELTAGKAAMRAGTVNFLVNSLDEALRILKNEIRKKQPVAVAVLGAMELVVAEMKERGVQPDVVLEDAGLGGEILKQV
jgi:urocanate hydratase